MIDVDRKKVDRLSYLNRLFDDVNGESDVLISSLPIGRSIGILNQEEIEQIVHYLDEEGLIRIEAFGDDEGAKIRITHDGVREIEEARTNPKSATEHFPPLINIINVGQMINSQIQQGTNASTQTQHIKSIDVKELQTLLNLIEKELQKHDIATQNRLDINAELGTIKAQLQSSKPKTSIIRESLISLKEFLTSVSADLAAAAILKYLSANGLM